MSKQVSRREGSSLLSFSNKLHEGSADSLAAVGTGKKKQRADARKGDVTSKKAAFPTPCEIQVRLLLNPDTVLRSLTTLPAASFRS